MPVKKKLILMGVAAALVTTTIIGGTLAATTYKGGIITTDASIETGNLDLAVSDAETGEETDEVMNRLSVSEPLMPGQSVSFSKEVTNTGVYPFYLRAVVYKTWNEEQEEMPRAITLFGEIDVPAVLSADKILATPGESWIPYYNGDEQIILYYNKVVQPGEVVTNPFISQLQLSTGTDNAYAGKQFTVEYTLQAVQADDGETAIATEWGVFPTFEGSTTTISSISEVD